MNHGHKKPTLIEPSFYDSPWQPTTKKRTAYFMPLELEILMHAYNKHEHIFMGRSDTATMAKEELSLNVVFSFNGEFSLITLIVLQIKTITGTETKNCFHLGAILQKKAHFEAAEN